MVKIPNSREERKRSERKGERTGSGGMAPFWRRERAKERERVREFLTH